MLVFMNVKSNANKTTCYDCGFFAGLTDLRPHRLSLYRIKRSLGRT